jgi:hypothetical protein
LELLVVLEAKESVYFKKGEKIMKRTLVLALVIGLALLSSLPVAFADTAKPIEVFINYNRVKFADQKPLIEEGRTLVPLRGVFEAMGAKVDWNPTAKVVKATLHDTTITLPIGNAVAQRNGQQVQLDVPAQVKDGRTMVPLRFIGEAFDGNVEWVPMSKSGHTFDYILIEGQFRFPNAPQDLAPKFGYNNEVDVKSFPIVITDSDLKITIHNITNSLQMWREPNNKMLFSKFRTGNDPNFDHLSKFSEVGILRIDAEFEALSDVGIQVDELTALHEFFLATYHWEKYDKYFKTHAPMNVDLGYLIPPKFEGFLPNAYLKKGEKIRGIVPLQHNFSNADPVIKIRTDFHNTRTITLNYTSQKVR